MTFKRAIQASALAAGVGLKGLFGVGLDTASADPGQRTCPGRLAAPRRRPGAQRPPALRLAGQQVTPIPAGNGAGGGFWFLGTWVPL